MTMAANPRAPTLPNARMHAVAAAAKEQQQSSRGLQMGLLQGLAAAVGPQQQAQRAYSFLPGSASATLALYTTVPFP